MNLNGDAVRDFTEALKYNKYAAHIYMNRGLLLFKIKDFKNSMIDLTAGKIKITDSQLFNILLYFT